MLFWASVVTDIQLTWPSFTALSQKSIARTVPRFQVPDPADRGHQPQSPTSFW